MARRKINPKLQNQKLFLAAVVGSIAISIYDFSIVHTLSDLVQHEKVIEALVLFLQTLLTGFIVVFVYQERNVKKAFFLGMAMQSMILTFVP